MVGIFLEALLILALILVNGILSLSEIAVLSARRSRLEERAARGDRGARTALELARDPSAFLSTVQIGITLVGILAGVFGGATIAEELAVALVPFAGDAAHALSIGLVVSVITFLSLVLGELVPKRIALARPARIAGRVAPPLRALSRLAAPLVRLLSGCTERIARLFGVREVVEAAVTEEEIAILLRQGERAGALEPGERDMARRVLRLGALPVETLMTHRSEIVWLDAASPEEETRRRVLDQAHSRYPVAEGNLDRLLGIVYARDLLLEALAGRPLDLRAVLRPPLYLHESATALEAMDSLRTAGAQFAILLDEYGGVQGIVTTGDILSAVVEGLPLADRPASPEVVRREDGSWLLDGRMLPSDFRETLGLGPLPDEDEGLYRTLGGFVMARLGRIPREGEQFEWSGVRFEVVDMDDRRVDKVLARRIGQEPAGKGEGPR